MASIYRFRSQTFSVVMEEPLPYGPCTSPRAAVPILRAIMTACNLDEDVEHFLLLALNAKGAVIGHKLCAQGTTTACLITPREFFRAALALGAVTALACHNHPSGDPAPSREDALLTNRLRSTGDTLGVPLADHIILGQDRHYSFRAEEGWDK